MAKSNTETQLAYFERDKLIWNSCLKPNEKLLLHALNSFVGGDGRCFPKHKVLAEMTSLGRSSIVRIMKSLEEACVVQVEWRYRSDGSQSSNDYFLDWERLKALNCKGVSKSNRGVSKSNTPLSNSDTGCLKIEHQELLNTTNQITNQISNNIDTFFQEKSDTDESNFETGITKNEEAIPIGNVTSGDQIPESCGRDETHETQNKTVEPPKKKMNWRPGKVFYYKTDSNGRIIYPKITDLHPSVKRHYNFAIDAANEETKQWIIENGFVHSISVEEDDDGDIYIDTLNDEYTLEEALREIPLAQMFQLGVHPDYGSLSAKEYNQYWAKRFIEYIIEWEDVPL